MNKIENIFRIIVFFIFILTNTNLNAQPYSYTDMSVFAERRTKFMEQISDGIAVFVSSPVYKRNGDVSHAHRQHSDFYYLTGFEEPNCAFILDPNGANKFIMFVQPKNPAIEIWTGKRAGVEGAITSYNADTAYPISALDSILNIYIENTNKIYYAKSYDKDFTAKLQNKLSAFKDEKILADPSEIIHEMRMFKSIYEIKLLKKAIDITCNAIIKVMKSAKPRMYEYELQAVLEYNFMKNGSQRIGFPSIVGSGPNSCILHYETNNRQTQNGDLVVMDNGAEYGYYTADVTRTFPVNGKFSKEQREIYQLVLDAQEAGIKMIKPGVKYNQVDSVARSIVDAGLRKLGILKEDEKVRKFFMHSTSHWLGLDVHDPGKTSSPGSTKSDRVLEPGMVLTVEPGIYIPEGTEGVNPKYYNIGVRIEDDILVTHDGYENLSALAPKKIADIEKLMNK